MASKRQNGHRRIASRGAVDAVLKSGEVTRTPFFRMHYRAGEGPPVVAFLAGRRVGGAVQRNRARRVLREAYRTSGMDLPGIEILVFVASGKAVGAPHLDVKDALIAALCRASDRASSRGNGKAVSAA